MKYVKIKNHGIKAVDNDGNEVAFSSAPTLIEKTLTIPEGLDPECITISAWEIVEDTEKTAAKVQKNRNKKLFEFRGIRDQKLVLCDHMVNDVALGNRDDVAAINTCRNALFAATEPYKTSQSVANADIDDLVIATYEWPSVS